MDLAFRVLWYTTSGFNGQLTQMVDKSKQTGKAMVKYIASRLAQNKTIQRIVIETNNKNHVILKIMEWSGDISFVIIALFSAFVLIKAFRKYKDWRKHVHKQHQIQTVEKGREGIKEITKGCRGLQMQVIKDILDENYGGRHIHDPVYHDDLNVDDEETMSTSSHQVKLSNYSEPYFTCEYDKDEGVHCHNCNISEASNRNDVINKSDSHSNRLMMEYLGPYMHHTAEGNRMNARNEKRHIAKKVSKFQQNYEGFRDSVLRNTCKGYFDHEKEIEYSDCEEILTRGQKRKNTHHKARNTVRYNKDELNSVNFFEILSQLSEQYVKE